MAADDRLATFLRVACFVLLMLVQRKTSLER